MDLLSIIGFVLALVSMIGGSILKGSGVAALWGPAAFVIVIIGTLAAITMHTPMPIFKNAMRLARWVIKPPKADGTALIRKIVEWSNSARKQGLLSLEGAVSDEPDPFIQKGLQMLVDGAEPEIIRSTLEVAVSSREHFDIAGAKVWESMGIYAPTLGIIGAVMGLMAVMQNLNDPSKLGHGISAAFVATLYGIGFANLLFLPMSAKIKAAIAEQTRTREMVIEGLISISQGENPRNIESKLQGYLH